MKRVFLLSIILPIVSCSPRVITSISSPLEPLDDGQPVVVIDDRSVQLQHALYVGSVEILDSGFSTNCGYDRVVELAKVEVRKAGGNYLVINEHRQPDLLSSCHRIAATIMRVDFPGTTDVALNTPDAPDAVDTPDTPDIEPQLSTFRSTDEYLTVSSAPAPPVFELSKWRFALDAAFSLRTAKISDNTSSSGLTDEQWKQLLSGLKKGVAYGVGVTRFFNNFYGLGAKFVGNHYANKLMGMKFGVDAWYFAPEFMMRAPTRNLKNAWIISISAGYVAYRESISDGRQKLSESTGGFKTTTEFGYDFRLSKGVSMGLKLVASSGAVHISDGSGGKVKNSLNAIEIGGGIRF